MTHSTPPKNPQYRGLQPNPEKLGVIPLLESEASQVLRVRGEQASVQWFQELTAEQRGDLVSQLHMMVGNYIQAPSRRAEAGDTAQRKVGRPAGKRSDPNFQQVTVLLNARTYRETRKRLVDEQKEVSVLLNELLENWLHK